MELRSLLLKKKYLRWEREADHRRRQREKIQEIEHLGEDEDGEDDIEPLVLDENSLAHCVGFRCKNWKVTDVDEKERMVS